VGGEGARVGERFAASDDELRAHAGRDGGGVRLRRGGGRPLSPSATHTAVRGHVEGLAHHFETSSSSTRPRASGCGRSS